MQGAFASGNSFKQFEGQVALSKESSVTSAKSKVDVSRPARTCDRHKGHSLAGRLCRRVRSTSGAIRGKWCYEYGEQAKVKPK